MNDGDKSKMGPQPRTGFARFVWLNAKRLVVAVIGFTVILVGVALLVLPGPGVAVIVGGLAILAVEFAWARRILQRGNAATHSALQKLGLKKKRAGDKSSENSTGEEIKDKSPSPNAQSGKRQVS